MQDLKQKIDIDKRSYNFAVNIVRFTKKLPKEMVGFELGKQLLRAGTSVAANIEEAQGAFSKDDFIYKVSISLKEAREASFWLRLIKDSALLINCDTVNPLIKESLEIKNILAAIINSSRESSR